jgi:hypothetical protein
MAGTGNKMTKAAAIPRATVDTTLWCESYNEMRIVIILGNASRRNSGISKMSAEPPRRA